MQITVPAEGSPLSTIALIGEAGGRQEEEKARPFVGESGELLTSLLNAAGIPRGSVYLTNVLKFRPLNNDLSPYVRVEKNGTVTEGPDWAAWRTALLEELSATSANVLVPLGNAALYALTNQWGISERRGSIYTIELGGRTRKVIPTFHPASALRDRNPLNRHVIHADLLRIRAEGATPEVRLPQRELVVLEGVHEVRQALGECYDSRLMGFDIESSTVRLKAGRCTREMIMFSFAPSAKRAFVVPLTNPAGAPIYSEMDELQLLGDLSTALEDPYVRKIGQNLHYDSSVLYHRYGVKLWPFDDTMLAHDILYPDLDADLGFLTSLYTREPYYKDTGAKHFTGKGSDWEGFLRYSALDAAVVLDIFPPLESALRKQGNWQTYRNTIENIPCLLHMQERGIRLDLPRQGEVRRQVALDVAVKQAELDALWVKVRERADPLYLEAKRKLEEEIAVAKANPKGRGTKGKEEKLYRMSRFSVKSTLDKKLFFFQWQKFKQPAKDPTSADALKRLTVQGALGAREVSELTKLVDDTNKYYKAKSDMDGRMRCAFQPWTENGRLGCKKSYFGTGCNFQNQPKRFKLLLRADPNCLFVGFDLAQAENRIVAICAGDEPMKRAFEQGKDIHCLTAARIFKVPVEQISDAEGSCPLGDGKRSQRDWGKTANHSLDGGMGPKKLAEKYMIPQKDANLIYYGVHAARPELKRYWKSIEQTLCRGRTLTNLFGRKRAYLGNLESHFLSAYRYEAQSDVADLINQVMREVFNAPDRFPDMDLVNQVHDALVYQVRVDRADVVADQLQRVKGLLEVVLEYRGYKFSIPADVKVGVNMGEMVKLNLDDREEAIATLRKVGAGA